MHVVSHHRHGEVVVDTHREPGWRYTLRRVRRHVHWARTEGVGRLVEEDQLDPRERVRTALAKRRWERRDGLAPGRARPVYVVGLQRSGTNMLMRGLDQAPEVEVRNENDRTVFDRFRLRSPEQLRDTVLASRHTHVVVKPLCDSQRVDELLDLPGMPPGRAVWCYRDVDGRARSEVSKFGDSNLQALCAIAEGRADHMWQADRLPETTVAMIRDLDPGRMSAYDGAALFWWARNHLFFDLGLDRRDDVMLSSYEAFVRDPDETMRDLCAHIGFPFRPALVEHVEARTSHGTAALDIDPAVRSLCESLLADLDRFHTDQHARLATIRPGGEHE